MQEYTPLTEPIYPPMGLFQRILCYIPLLGPMIESAYWNSRNRVAFDFISRQINSRSVFPDNKITSQSEKDIAIQIATIIMCCQSWNNNYFLYDDKLGLLLACDEDFESNDVFHIVSRVFKIPEKDLMDHYANNEVTFGEFVKYVLVQKREN